MKVALTPQTARATIPITIDVTEVTHAPQILVQAGENQNTLFKEFTLQPTSNAQGYSATFWLQTPGDYNIIVTSGTETQTKSLQITPQVYLSFGNEFMIFSSSLFIALLGVYLWFRISKTHAKKLS